MKRKKKCQINWHKRSRRLADLLSNELWHLKINIYFSKIYSKQNKLRLPRRLSFLGWKVRLLTFKINWFLYVKIVKTFLKVLWWKRTTWIKFHKKINLKNIYFIENFIKFCFYYLYILVSMMYLFKWNKNIWTIHPLNRF